MYHSEDNEIARYSYSVFNKDNWNYNVDKFFFLFLLGMVYVITRLIQLDFDVSTLEVFARILTGPWTVLFAIVLLESLFAVITKVGLEPGIILESKFAVFKVFFNTVISSYRSWMTFKEVYSVKHIIVRDDSKPWSGQLFINASGICGDYQGTIELPGYLKKPEHFNY